MRRTVADNTLRMLGIALACTGCASGAMFAASAGALASTGGTALASTGGTAVSHAATTARTGHSHSHGAHSGGSASGRRKSGAGEQIATWFGPGFYGQKTACGQMLTPMVVGVASRTLPCGTLVLVDYDGHKLTVPVIDRGPYAHNGAVWDLTRGAASALSIEDTVRITTKIVGRAPNTPLLGVPAEVKPIAGAAAAPAS